MKKIFFVVIFILFSKAFARSSGPGGFGMEIESESIGIGGSGKFPSEIFWGTGSNRIETSGIGGSGMENPRDFSISTEGPFRLEYSREIGPGAF
jgi:hypothetical protein